MNQQHKHKDMLGRTGLIPVSEARELLLKQLTAIKVQTETVTLANALDRVLAEPVNSQEILPPHPRAVMDGFAVIGSDTFGASESMPAYLEITGSVAMGEMPQGEVEKGCCFKIATGGFLPKGADAVVMFEHTVAVDDSLIEIVKGVGSGTNIIQRGDDINRGDEALPAGKRLRPQDLGLLAAIGHDSVLVTNRIKVGILSTGDEIVEHTTNPEPGQIRDINSIALSGLVKRAHATPVNYGIISDEKAVFYNKMEQAVEENDLVIFSGGSSVGVRDLGEQIVEALGPPGILVHGVALKPGKPVLIGMSGSVPVFGLPGHPVSAMVCFEKFVQPAIEALEKFTKEVARAPVISARLTRNINSAPGRLDVVRVRLLQQGDSILAEPILGRSGSISTLSRANGYFLIDEQSQGVTKDSSVEVFIYR